MRSAEPVSVRVASFLVIMETKPNFHTLHIIASSLNDEKNLQIASFVYSYLTNVARAPEKDIGLYHV